MKCRLKLVFFTLVWWAGMDTGECAAAEGMTDAHDGGVTSEVIETGAGELILLQQLIVAAPVEQVWNAYTTAEGWTAWAAPLAEVDLRVGGTIRTAYAGALGGEHTNTLRIVNYVPHRVLTLKADVSANWPEVMKKDADRLSNVVVFDATADGGTRIQSFGIGYTDSPELRELMGFFIKANEGLLENLRAYLRSGTRVDWQN